MQVRGKMPKTSPGYVGRHFTYPDMTGKRQAEGGRRLLGERRHSHAKAPLVSVITVCWNSAKTLEQAMLSVFEQTYKNIEYLIVDGLSTDGTVDLIRKYEDRIEYFVSEPDQGLYFALNKGLELAQGEYILILNSDDWYAPDCVETLLAAKLETKADFVSALADYVNDKGELTHHQPSFPFDAGVYFRMPLRHETMFIPADLYNRFGPYDTQYFINADRALTVKLFEAGVTHFEVQKSLMSFRNDGVSSTNMEKLYAEREKMLLGNFPMLTEADATVLARLPELKPQQLVEITRRHGQGEFAEAALDYAKDRKARSGSGEWANFDLGELMAAAVGAQPADDEAPASGERRPLRVATLITSDHGGAGIGSQRRVEALRRAGVDNQIHCLFKKTDKAHVHKVAPMQHHPSEQALRAAWRDAGVLTKAEMPGLLAREMFSKTGTVVDFGSLWSVIDRADIVHLHWMSGMFDFANAGILADKPVAWTLADMNAFSGGCHYSEGCTEYRNECRNCPLLPKGSDLAHRAWKTKRDAYSKIKNLHIICPSQWLADRVRESSLLGDRPVHALPNALPVNRFTPINRMVARRALSLPLNRKLIIFGADNLTNSRKGGDILAESLNHLRAMGQLKNVEGVYFGASNLDLGIKGHNMGHVSDDAKMSLIYAAGDVFAFPSREDNAPLTVVESMLSGTPVVGFPVGNVSELVDHMSTGYIARHGDAKDFAQGLAWALRDVEHADTVDRSLRCHLKARAHNDPDTSVTRHLAVYAEMLKGSERYYDAISLRYDFRQARARGVSVAPARMKLADILAQQTGTRKPQPQPASRNTQNPEKTAPRSHAPPPNGRGPVYARFGNWLKPRAPRVFTILQSFRRLATFPTQHSVRQEPREK